jgi:apolipoprotein N-acyltransferase
MRIDILKKMGLSFLTSVLLLFSFPNFMEPTVDYHTSFLMWAAFVPLICLWSGIKGEKGSFFYPFISAFVFYAGSLYWMCLVGPMGPAAYPACAAVCAYFSLIIAGSFYFSALAEKKTGISVLFTLPAILTISEFAREWFISGWPILTPAQSQNNFTLFMRVLRTFGAPGANFIIYSTNMLIVAFITGEIKKIKKWENILWISMLTVIVIITLVPGGKNGLENTKLKIAAIQRNIDQNVDWTGVYASYTMAASKDMYSKLSGIHPDLVIWPETGYPGILNRDPSGASEIASWNRQAYSLVGSDTAILAGNGTDYFNGAYIVTPSGTVSGYYAKHHLVPFGEYIPFQDVLPFVRKVVQRYGYEGFKSGSLIEPLEFNGIKAGTLICYDSFFPEIARVHARKGAQFLAHLSYESWYGHTPASAQIFMNAALRSAECGIYMVRCVESGISGVVDDTGKIVFHTGLFTKEFFSYDVPVSAKPVLTFYCAHGDIFPCILLAILIAAAFIKWKMK